MAKDNSSEDLKEQPLDGWSNSEDPQDGHYTGVVINGEKQKIDYPC
jgi:hypothetical protein